MLDAYIIEQIRKREEERRRIYERPALEIPLDDGYYRIPDRKPVPKEEPSRVIIIDL